MIETLADVMEVTPVMRQMPCNLHEGLIAFRSWFEQQRVGHE